jgi:hypothetical protein
MLCYLDPVSNGEVLLRLGPDIERLRKAAEAEGISMSQFLREGMEMRIAAGQPESASLTAALRLLERTARQLIGEPLPASPNGIKPPSDEHKKDHWDRLMSDG